MGWWQRYLNWRHRHVSALELTANGFRMRAGPDSRIVSWSSIGQITAFKRDLLTIDMLCLLLELDDGIIEINEQMIGYAAMEQAMMQTLGLSHEWKLEVLFPAFAANPQSIYRRGDA